MVGEPVLEYVPFTVIVPVPAVNVTVSVAPSWIVRLPVMPRVPAPPVKTDVTEPAFMPIVALPPTVIVDVPVLQSSVP
jgi:hypothetical protein